MSRLERRLYTIDAMFGIADPPKRSIESMVYGVWPFSEEIKKRRRIRANINKDIMLLTL